MKYSVCKACKKKVIFAKDGQGKTQILDAVAPTYCCYLGPTPTCRRAEWCFVSHFATCPNANDFSKNKKGSQPAKISSPEK